MVFISDNRPLNGKCWKRKFQKRRSLGGGHLAAMLNGEISKVGRDVGNLVPRQVQEELNQKARSVFQM